jgi:TIR domain
MPPTSTQQFSGIFVSYRRDDTAGHSGRLADRLVEHFGRDRIFMDVDTIEPGEDFVTVIENAVGSCDILIAVIGQNWLSASGSGRLDNPNNFVRLEIGTALRRDIRVIPVLVQRASMPKPQDLPEELVKLTRRNAIELTDLRWTSDVEQLIGVMERVLAKRLETKQVVEPNHSDENQPHPEVEENVQAQHEKDSHAGIAGKGSAESTQQSQEGQTAEKPHVGEAAVRESNFAATQNRFDAPATIVTSGTASPAYKPRLWMFVAGAALIGLVVATIMLWPPQPGPVRADDANHSATPQPSAVPQQSTPAPTPTTEVKASPTPPAVPFSEPSFWKRDDAESTYKIVREGNTLRAFMDKPSDQARATGRKEGDLAFEATFKRKTIKGTAYVRYNPKIVSRCPSLSGEQAFDLELTLSEDGNTLFGSREDFKIPEDCIPQPAERLKIMYNKISP